MRTIPAALGAAFLILLAGCSEAPKAPPSAPAKTGKPMKAAQADGDGAAEEGSAGAKKEGSASMMEGSAKAAGTTAAEGAGEAAEVDEATSIAPREVKTEDLAAHEFSEPKHSMALPKDWTAAATPANKIRIFTAAVPKYKDDEKDAELTVSKAMGGWDANVKRYQGQFGGDASLKKNEELTTAGGVKVHYALFKGTYTAPSFSGGGTFTEYAMGVAMLSVEDGTYFIKLLGPRHTVEWQENGFIEALKSFK
jgi:hypothetical protein